MKQDNFKTDLYNGINQYFAANNLSRYANRQMHIKLIVAACWWLISFVLLFTISVSRTSFFLLYAFHCFAQLFILLNIAHDANHAAIFKKNRLRSLLRYSFDLCGVNSYMWRELHHAQHHNCMNIDGEDETLVLRNLMRYTDRKKHRWIYKFQHLYFFVFYGLFTADWVFTKDFECFFFPHTAYLKKKKHPRSEIVKLVVGKLFYIGYMVILPVWLLGFSFGFVLLTFVICHFLIGIIGGAVIQITHPLTGADFPESRNQYEHFVYHVFATTADYSVNSRIADWFFGGLHLHVIHHLSPGICHTHYRQLTKIIKIVSEKHKVNYRVNKTMFDAIKDHYLHLKSLSN